MTYAAAHFREAIEKLPLLMYFSLLKHKFTEEIERLPCGKWIAVRSKCRLKCEIL